MAKSIDKKLAEATAASAANTARKYPHDKRMQQLAKEYADRAARTK